MRFNIHMEKYTWQCTPIWLTSAMIILVIRTRILGFNDWIFWYRRSTCGEVKIVSSLDFYDYWGREHTEWLVMSVTYNYCIDVPTNSFCFPVIEHSLLLSHEKSKASCGWITGIKPTQCFSNSQFYPCFHLQYGLSKSVWYINLLWHEPTWYFDMSQSPWYASTYSFTPLLFFFLRGRCFCTVCLVWVTIIFSDIFGKESHNPNVRRISRMKKSFQWECLT